jgi:hypothetical protein
LSQVNKAIAKMNVRRRDDSIITVENIEKQNADDGGELFDISDENADTIALDVDMMSVLQSRQLKGDLKWFQYYKALERYLYKRDPTFKPLQFTFEVQEGSTGELVYIIRPGQKKKKSPFAQFLKFSPNFIGPLVGGAIHALIRFL